MQQNRTKPEHKILPQGHGALIKPFQSTESYLAALCQLFPKGTEASRSAMHSLSLIKKININIQATKKNKLL